MATTEEARPAIRFAPSPNGRLHLGHAYSALLAHDTARAIGARFLLRIDDIDTARCTPEFEQAIYDDLAWLGLSWETPVRRQSEHFSTYRQAAEELGARGLLYPCFATRKEIAETVARVAKPAFDPDGAPLYPGLYRNANPEKVAQLMAEGRPYALRLDMARARDAVGPAALTYRVFDLHGGARECLARPERWGDAVIVRKDTPTSYHLANVIDDALQGITHVIRGTDLEAATDLHVLLQRLLGLPTPAYHHHRLILDESGRKLSKSAGDLSLAALREHGATPEQIRCMVGLAS
ncbi:tRNA glutamyl-Q(34) synthetase GluQRS [Dichotomicrobium thermohalophilum]|uniref:Glutamyl-Q tRNA(Asp) synthetase n=1 Tax=Dichotomicrobium thermohalophilum TaxID=933063 RepID=A0A397Q6V4_9HYPH|nr:tRNA glutamyl-Q(34) synthetase GluQRS [Dichotomicrobium thermohalophilum]RIA56693.1 glutamyl-Q tRNA(Asp) synthetase [Dichotomicrobium thermohalophilum]